MSGGVSSLHSVPGEVSWHKVSELFAGVIKLYVKVVGFTQLIGFAVTEKKFMTINAYFYLPKRHLKT